MAMIKPSCLSLAIPKGPTTGDFPYPWLSSSAHLTPPYSPGKLPCSSSPSRRYSDDSSLKSVDIPAVVGGLLAIAPQPTNNGNKTTKFPPAPACCELHESNGDRPLDSEGSIIHEGCIGSVTVHRREPIPDWAVGMTGRELEIRVQIAEIQKLYRDHQKELHQMSRTRRPSGKPRKISSDQANSKITVRARRNSASERRHTHPGIDDPAPKSVDEKRFSVPEITIVVAVDEKERDEKSVEKDVKEKVEAQLTPPEIESPKNTPEPIQNQDEADAVEETRSPKSPVEIESSPIETISDENDRAAPAPMLGLEEEQEEQVDEEMSNPESPAGKIVQPVQSPRKSSIFPAILTPEALVSGTRVIVLEGGLFYSGTLKVIDADALIFQVQMDGQRSTRPYILCQEELLMNALRELPLSEKSNIHAGLRVCAVWSGQLQALYPGTVTGFAEETDKGGRRLVSIEFDDGDCGNIRLDDIRLLPPDFPITKTKTPVLPEFITRKRSTATARERSSTIDRPSRPIAQQHQPPPKRRHTVEITSDDKESTPDAAGRKWQWAGKARSDKRLRRTLYSAVKCDSVQVKVGDLVHMLEPFGGQKKAHKADDRYVAVVERFWETKSGAKKLRVAWCYRAHEIVPRIHVNAVIAKRALFRSDHYDDNCVQSLSEKCEMLSWTEFKKLMDAEGNSKIGPNVYFEAGHYDPVNCKLEWADDCDDLCAASSKSQ